MKMQSAPKFYSRSDLYCLFLNTVTINSQDTLCIADGEELTHVHHTGSNVSVHLLSGCGEHLIRTMLARECSAAMQSEDAHRALLEAMQNKFISEYFIFDFIHIPYKLISISKKHGYAQNK